MKATARFGLLSEARIYLLGFLNVVSGFMLRKYASIPSGFSLLMIIMLAFAFYAFIRGLGRAVSLFTKFLALAYIIDIVLDIQPWLPVPRHGMKIDPFTVLLGFCDKVAWLLFSNQPGLWWMIVSRIGLLLIVSGFIAAVWGLIRARKAEAILTDRRLIVMRGAVSQSETSIPLSAVVTITAHKTLMGQTLSLGLRNGETLKLKAIKKQDFEGLYSGLISSLTQRFS